MSRTKGALNKPKSTAELINQLRERGFNIPPEVVPADAQGEKPPKLDAKALEVKPAAGPASGVTREKFALTQNRTEASQQGEITVYRCGNSLCNTILSDKLPICPKCGARLTWHS